MDIFWDTDLVDRIESLHLMARELVWGITTGAHRSTQSTRSIEFKEHKEYAPGDPLNAIDWRVYARTDRLMIKKQQADTEANIVLVLDASADMATSAGLPDLQSSKLGKAITLAAAITIYAERSAEPVGLMILSGEDDHQHFIPPSRRSVPAIFGSLSRLKANGEANLQEGLRVLVNRLHKKSIVFIVSDWMEEPDEWGPSLEILAGAGHDVRVLHLYSENEWELNLPDAVKLYSYEEPEQLVLDIDRIREEFGVIVSEYRQEIQKWSTKSKALWSFVALENELLLPLATVLKGL